MSKTLFLFAWKISIQQHYVNVSEPKPKASKLESTIKFLFSKNSKIAKKIYFSLLRRSFQLLTGFSRTWIIIRYWLSQYYSLNMISRNSWLARSLGQNSALSLRELSIFFLRLILMNWKNNVKLKFYINWAPKKYFVYQFFSARLSPWKRLHQKHTMSRFF